MYAQEVDMSTNADVPKGKRKQGLKADYKGATPEQVAEAVLRYRPGKAKVKPTSR